MEASGSCSANASSIHDWSEVSQKIMSLLGGNAACVGYVSYSAASMMEKLPYKPPSPFFDVEFASFSSLVESNTSLNRFVDDARNATIELPESKFVSDSLGRTGYESAVTRAKRYVRSGDVFQVVPARKMRFSTSGDWGSVFARLVALNPSAYMYYLKFAERRIIGSSPETLIDVRGESAATFPIAGTRQITGDQEEDRKLRLELLASEKDAAEHVMLVDLARNDLGRVCKIGTVRVPLYRKVISYSHVQHIVSKVTGRLLDGVDALDAFRSVFPAGTVSGAPKIRAMEIIDELEPCARGPYAGAVGIVRGTRSADFAINIRSLSAIGNDCYLGVGAGVVADSDPEQEFMETQHKANALLTALRANPLAIEGVE